MKKTIGSIAFLLAIIFIYSCKNETKMHGFKLIEKRFVKEINAECYLFEHEKSGARLLKIANNDPNKTFAIGFKTIPYSDNGVAHILEHSVLNGSKNFPVKSPFDILSKGSLNTFINASTSKDRTVYPLASMNEKDFFNLMHIYLDAVFNPLLYKDTRVLKQEGWHYELENKESPIIYKGVVYNEMKGAFSNPSRELRYLVYKTLYPDNCFGKESGGHPSAIPDLTQKEFTDFHSQFYHPENSYIYLYGDGNTDKELEFIDTNYLSKYERINKKAEIEDQKPFAEMKKITGFYPAMEGVKTENQTFLEFSFVPEQKLDYKLNYALDIISEVLINQESAPLRLELQKAGIGQDVYVNSELYKNYTMRITVPNANPADRDKFYNILMATCKDQVSKGLDKDAVQGVLNRIEFQLREGNDAQKGISYVDQSLTGWLYLNDPFAGLEYEKVISDLKESIKQGYLESVIDKYIIKNPHSLLVSLEPKPGLETEINNKVAEKLANFKKSLSADSINSLVNETQKLIAFQKREDTPEALATIPLLDIKDINPKAQYFEAAKTEINGVPVLHYEDFTNNIVYVNMYFDTRVLPQELIPYAAILTDLFTSINTKNYSYGDLNKAINLNTGGINFVLKNFLENQDDNKMMPKFNVTSKALVDKTNKLFELSSEIINKSIFTDTARLKTVFTKLQSQYEYAVKSNGYKYAKIRLSSYFSNNGYYDEITKGLEYYWFLTDILKNYNAKANEISNKLQQTANLLFNSKNLIIAATCNKQDFNAVTKEIENFTKALQNTEPKYQTWNFKLEKKNEGILTSAKIQFVTEGYDFKKLGYAYNGKLMVLEQILSTDWLHNRIRVMGGAYGGSSYVRQNGFFGLLSYRDPNLKESLDNYAGTVGYLENFKADQKTMTRYIIGTIATLDNPYTPSDKGEMAFGYYFTKQKQEDVQKLRDEVLSTTSDDIKAYSKLLKEIINQKALCVYGNSEKINSNKKIFKNLIKLER